MTIRYILCMFLIGFSPVLAEEKVKDPYEAQKATSLFGFAPDPVLYTGMWTMHFKNASKCNWKNEAFGLEIGGVFVSTMINTYHQRCYTAGVSRYWYKKRLSENFTFAFGYRFGGIYGYDSKLKSIAAIAEKYKVLPYGQLYTHLIYKRIRVEVSYINQLFSLHLAILLNTF